MTGPEVGVAAILVDDEDLLLVRRASPPHEGLWTLPGGRIEAGETAVEAVVRELREETGLDGICDRFVGFVELLPEETEGRHLVILEFELFLLERVEPVAASDVAEARWVHEWDVAEQALTPGLAEFLHEHHFIETIT